jgi:crotonobetainyl-CoA:carnitine CoA-transferase CaiB-like acyl-CoA transferase
VPQPLGHRHRLNAPYQLFPTKDGRYIAIGTPNDQLFVNLMTVIGLAQHIGDPRFVSYASRKQNEDALMVLVEPAVCQWQSAELEAALMQAGVPCACVNNFKQVFDDPHMIDRGIVKDTEHPQLGPMRAVRNPILLDHDGPSIERPAPMLGQHSREILRDLGYSDATISGYFEAGVTAERQAKSPPAEAAE